MRFVVTLPSLSVHASLTSIHQKVLAFLSQLLIIIRFTIHNLTFALWSFVDPIPRQKHREALSLYLQRVKKRHARRIVEYWLFLLPEIDYDYAEMQYRHSEFGNISFNQFRNDLKKMTALRLELLNAASLVFSDAELLELAQ